DIHVHAETAGFHPHPDRDCAFIRELNPGKVRTQTLEKFLLAQLCRLHDSLLVFEKLNNDKAGSVEGISGLRQENLPRPGLMAQKSREENISVNNDAVGIHSVSYSPKRRLFFSHQSALISSDNCQAAFSVSVLRRAILSTRNQLTK